jgi:uncharacterized membrane protein
MLSRLSMLLGTTLTVTLGLPLLVRTLNRRQNKIKAFADNDMDNIYLTRAITVIRPVEDVYRFWHNLTRLPKILDYIESVHAIGNTLTRWTLNLPLGLKTTFDVETYIDIPNTMIGWRSLPKSELQTGGWVRFQPMETGTEVQLTVEFGALPSPLRQSVCNLVNETYIDHCLQAYKQKMERLPPTINERSGECD